MADVTGVYGPSFVILLVNATLFGVFRQWLKKDVPCQAGDFLIHCPSWPLDLRILKDGRCILGTLSSYLSLKIGLVQGNIDQ